LPNGSSTSSINGRAAAAAAVVAAADGGSDTASSSQQQQQQQRQPLFRPLRRPTESDSPADHSSRSSSPAAEQQQQQQQGEVLQASSPGEPGGYEEDTAAGAAGSSSSSSSAFQQQLEAELSYEEDEQQQQRFLRQQQRQMPSLLEDAAAGRTPCFILVPIGSSSSSNGAFAAAAPLLSDRQGQQLQQLEVPCLGPLLLTNSPQVFRSADVLVDAPGEHYERLALSLELVKPTGSSEAVLQARNLSRVVRGRINAATVHVNDGQTELLPHRAAIELTDGDVIELGDTGVAFEVRRQQQQQQVASPAVHAVRQFCGVYAQQQLGLQINVQDSLQLLQQQQQVSAAAVVTPSQQQQQQQQGVAAGTAISQGWNAAAADAIEAELRGISRLVRSNARAAEIELCRLAAAHPDAPGPWFLWAQLAASSRRHWMARALFRAAAVCQQQQLEQVLRAGPAAAAAAGAVAAPQLLQDGAEDADSSPAAAVADDPAFSLLQPTPMPSSSNTGTGGSRAIRRKADGMRNAASRSPAFRLSSRLVQVLRVWARSEWEQRLFGPARRLWRLAANEAFKFPYDVAAEGGGAVLHAWASAEFDRDNVLNARVVIGEALRKCPKDAAVSARVLVACVSCIWYCCMWPEASRACSQWGCRVSARCCKFWGRCCYLLFQSALRAW
jgi:hypothetical protein